jgi:hypothetical protein
MALARKRSRNPLVDDIKSLIDDLITAASATLGTSAAALSAALAARAPVGAAARVHADARARTEALLSGQDPALVGGVVPSVLLDAGGAAAKSLSRRIALGHFACLHLDARTPAGVKLWAEDNSPRKFEAILCALVESGPDGERVLRERARGDGGGRARARARKPAPSSRSVGL